MHYFYLKRHLSLITLILLLSACGGQTDNSDLLPTDTPEPPVLTMLITPPEGFEDAALLDTLENEIRERTGYVVDIQMVSRTAEALRAVCDTTSVLTAAWLDGMTYAAAAAQNCGQPALVVVRDLNAKPEVVVTEEATATDEVNATAEASATEEVAATEEATATEEPAATDEVGATEEVSATEEASAIEEVMATEEAEPNILTGLPGVIVVNSSLGTSSLSAIVSRTFCRLAVTDFYSWLLPTLAFDAAGVDLTAPNVTIVEYADNTAMLEAVASGECAMAGLPQTLTDAGLIDGVTIAQTTPAFPFSVLVYPTQLESGVRTVLTDALLAIADDPEAGVLLSPLLGQVALLPATTDDFQALTTFINSTGLNFSELGK